MLHALAFVLAREEALPRGETIPWSSLEEAQRQGLRSGTQLRIFRVPVDTDANLSTLVDSGDLNADGDQPCPQGAPAPLICDALVPLIEPRSLWLGVYQVTGERSETPPVQGLPLQIQGATLLDAYPLQEAANETCWFYPTENGRYLAWENRREIRTLPGHLPDRSPQTEPFPYARGDVHLLWSLMADDLALTCVGLTYRRQRIEWPVIGQVEEALSTWNEFQVDAMAESSYLEINSTSLFRSTEASSSP